MLAILAMLAPSLTARRCAWLRVAPRAGSGFASAPFHCAARDSHARCMVGTEEQPICSDRTKEQGFLPYLFRCVTIYIGDFMADDFNLVLEHLRHIRGAVDTIRTEQGLHGQRLTSIERNLMTFRDEIDSVKVRLDRIETRLGLNEPEH